MTFQPTHHTPPVSQARAVAADTMVMRLAYRASLALMIFAMVLTAFLISAVPGRAQTLAPATFADLVDQVGDSVVNITTSSIVAGRAGPQPIVPEGSPLEDFFNDFMDRNGQGEQAPRRSQALGSGFVISEDGFIVTNNHVIEGADEIMIEFRNGIELSATLVGTDPNTDIALLKVEATMALPFVPFGDSGVMRVGDWVMAMGNPLGQGFSVSVGIVSAQQRALSGTYDDYIQTDAAINRGNSGGPLFNMDGQVIGVNTAIISPSGGSIGIGFSVPSAIVSKVVRQIQEFGGTRRGWLGVQIQSVTDELAEGLGLSDAQGALVSGVVEDGPAAAAGLEVGDVIRTFDGKDIVSMRDLPRIVAEADVGAAVGVVIWRKGASMTLQVELGLLEEDPPVVDASVAPAQSEEMASVLGLTLGPITPKRREGFGIAEDVTGVLVTEVDEAGPASAKGVKVGDVIVEVAQEAVATPEDVLAKVKAAEDNGRRTVLLLVHSGGELRFIAVSLDR